VDNTETGERRMGRAGSESSDMLSNYEIKREENRKCFHFPHISLSTCPDTEN
jgi:hypothetical protein